MGKIEAPEGGFWLLLQEPDERTARAMLHVSPETYTWIVPDTDGPMAPEGTSWS